MKKLCCIFNTPSLYRKAIYKLIDSTFPCDWYFEDTDNRLAVFDTTELKQVSYLHAIPMGAFYRVRGLRHLIRKTEYSHYLMMGHSRNLSSLTLLLQKKLFYREKKVYLWTHGLYGKETKFEFLWKKLIYTLADGVFVYGDRAKMLMLQKGFPEEKIFAIHNSLDYPQQFALRQQLKPSSLYYDHFCNDNKNIVFIGRLTKVKKFDLLLKAVSHLKDKGFYVNVTFIGDGTERQRMEFLVKEMGIEKQVWFYGACYDEKTNAEMIYNADLCVSPGNIGLTAMHVLMFGCPAITNDDFDSQMPEYEAIKDGETGAFFKADDSDSLAKSIENWFEKHSGEREQVRQACYSEIDENWNPDYQINLIKKVINSTNMNVIQKITPPQTRINDVWSVNAFRTEGECLTSCRMAA